MSVEAITDTILEYMYEKMNESPDAKEEAKIKHVDRKGNYPKPKKVKPNKSRKVNSISVSIELEQTIDCPAKTKKCPYCGKIGHYAKLPNQIKIGPDDKTHLSGIRSNQRRRGRLVTEQNTPHS